MKQDVITSAQSFLDSHPETKHHFDEVTKLVNGFESPYGMELLSTVHWVVTHECAGDEINPDEVVSKVHSWSERAAQKKPVHIKIKAAFKRLCDEQWLNKVAPSL